MKVAFMRKVSSPTSFLVVVDAVEVRIDYGDLRLYLSGGGDTETGLCRYYTIPLEESVCVRFIQQLMLSGDNVIDLTNFLGYPSNLGGYESASSIRLFCTQHNKDVLSR